MRMMIDFTQIGRITLRNGSKKSDLMKGEAEMRARKSFGLGGAGWQGSEGLSMSSEKKQHSR